jgi:hypothetical protein
MAAEEERRASPAEPLERADYSPPIQRQSAAIDSRERDQTHEKEDSRAGPREGFPVRSAKPAVAKRCGKDDRREQDHVELRGVGETRADPRGGPTRRASRSGGEDRARGEEQNSRRAVRGHER